MSQQHSSTDQLSPGADSNLTTESGLVSPASSGLEAKGEVEEATDLSAEARLGSQDAAEFLSRIIEAALLAAGDSLSIERLSRLFEESEQPSGQEFEQALTLLKARCEGRGFELVEVASGWRLQVREEFAPWVNRLWEEKPQKYSRALLETLALIAYRQPITRGDIEDVRGVAVSSHIIKTLAEREWIKVVGTRDVPGRPSLYATTRQFLDYFNLKSLEDLPTLSELKDIDNLNQSLELGAADFLAESVAQEMDQIADAQAEGSEAAPEISADIADSVIDIDPPHNLTLMFAASGSETESHTTDRPSASVSTQEDLNNV